MPRLTTYKERQAQRARVELRRNIRAGVGNALILALGFTGIMGLFMGLAVLFHC